MFANVRWVQGLGRPGESRLSQVLPMVASLIVLACLAAVTVDAQSAATTEILRREFLGQEFAVKSFGPVRWLDGGRAYTTLEASAMVPSAKSAADAGEAAVDLVRYDTATAQREVLIAAQQLTPDGPYISIVCWPGIWKSIFHPAPLGGRQGLFGYNMRYSRSWRST